MVGTRARTHRADPIHRWRGDPQGLQVGPDTVMIPTLIILVSPQDTPAVRDKGQHQLLEISGR